MSTEQRLKLFIAVCEAAHHAHQKAVIHRDLKPSNVLVTVMDGDAVPKIIDFGIAKATNRQLTEQTVFTELGQLIGTPAYMSPEQAEMTGLDIDTRTDVYSLGILLYELLVGALPLDVKTLARAGYAEIQRIIRDEEPNKPSTKVSRLEDAASSDVANLRQTNTRSLNRKLRGDLDCITMKAIAKDRTQRYQASSDLAADIQRYLDHEPVVAGPPSVTYRLRKSARKHRRGLVVATMMIILLIVASVAVARISARNQERRLHEQSRAFFDKGNAEFAR